MSNTIHTMHELGFADEEIAQCLENKKLLSVELEFTRKCNLRCIYCYSDAGVALEDEMSLEEIKSVALQAKALGAKKMILLGGGEPLMYRGLTEVVSYINSLGLQQILFSNGTLINREMANYLFENRVSVIIKSNSFRPEVQDLLAGVDGVSKNIKKGMDLLMDAGYPGEDAMLGIQTVICRQNIDELPSMWAWARQRGIVPYFEMLTKQGRARTNMSLDVEVHEIRRVFEQIEAIDRERFGITWQSRPTIVAFSCKRHLYSCLINSQGYVQPCTGIDIAIGNIRKKPLQDILENSSMITNLRNIYEKIEGACRACEHNCECYGCRGNAYQITGNYLASDPTCWRLQQINS